MENLTLQNHLKISGYIFFILSYIFIPDSQAQVEGDTSLYRELNPVVITGTRFELEKSKAPGAITIVSREEIEQNGHVNILPVLSTQVPGLFLNNRNMVGFGVGPNSGGNISIRGISGTPNSRVLVLIDGQPQFMGIFAHPIADAYSTSDIERAEVIRGASSLLYGSNAMGGTINLITRKATQEGWQGSAKLAYGSYHTGILSGTLAYKKESLNTFFSINRTRTDGFRKEGRDDFHNTTAFLKIGYSLGQSFDLSADVQIADAIYYHPGTVTQSLENDKREYVRGRGALSLKNSFKNVEGGIFLFYNWGDHQFEDGFHSNDINQGLTFFQNIIMFSGNTITLGMDHKKFGGTAYNETLPPPARVGLGENHKVIETDFYISIQQQLIEKLSLHGGIRWANNSIYGDNFLPSAGINYQASENTYFKTLFSKAFRSPAVAELFLFPTSNVNLQPEEVSNFELGISQLFWDKIMEVELTGFVNEGENLIQVVPVAEPPEARNTGSFSNKGLEAQLKYHPLEKLSILLNYSRIDVSENILYSPRQMINLQVNYGLEKFSVSADIQQTNGLRNSYLPDQPLENYSLVNLRSRYKLTEYLNIFAEGNNLLNTSYEVENGYPMPGINFLGGLNMKF
jgi:iron complex outermembrane receptor protein